MNNRRTNLQIVAEILRLGDTWKSDIIFSVNMSHAQLQQYLGFMTERGFLRDRQDSKVVTYHTTKKGQQLLECIDRVTETLGFESGQM